MRRVLHFLIRHQFLPRWKWLYQQVEKHLVHREHPRDEGQISGWIELPVNTTAENVSYFRRWWESRP